MTADSGSPGERTQAGPLVVVRDLEAVFASGLGVGPASLTIAPGEEVLVLGPSGSGKSTLLRLLHGAIPHAIHARVTGSVHVAGRDVAEAGVADLADVVGVVGQDPTAGVCLPEIDDELAFPLENLSWDPALIPGRVRGVLELVDAAHLSGRLTEELSGGELQRIALAAATVAGPRLLLLDEPTSMLDAAGIAGVRRAVAEVRRSTGAAVVLVEHRLDEYAGDAGLAGLPARWIVVDRSGRLTFDGPPTDLTDAAVADLLAAGCWLPRELEARVLGPHPDATPAPLTLATPRLAPEVPQGSATEGSRALGGHGRRRVRSSGGDGRGEPADGAHLVARSLSVAPGGATRRRSAPVLTEVDLELVPGRVAALVGANGQGKSSLLTCLAGLHQPVAGSVTGPRAGLVFQNPEDQFQASSVRAEVGLGLPAGSEARVTQLLQRFDLADLADANPHQLSGGQKRRLSLAAMLVHEHPFLLADEPGFGLDRHATVAVLGALREVAAAGRGVLFSSHDLRAVAATAHDVVVVAGGTVVRRTTPRGLLTDADLLAGAGLQPARWLVELATRCADDVELAVELRHSDALVADLVRPVAA